MSKIKDGGPAFGHGNHEQGGSSGMSLRDWFAGQAMAALIIANGGAPCALSKASAGDAYTAADAMLAAREAQP